MGAKDSKPCCITYEEAVKRVTDAEQRRLRDAFKRASNLSGVITKPAFIKEVLGEFVPIKLAEHIYQACGGTQKGITFKDLLCGLVLLTNGYKEEKIKFIFSLYANELGTHVTKDEMVRLVQASDGGYISEAVADCFTESDKVSFEEFRDWLYSHPDATSLTKWLLSEPCSVSLFNDLETPTFYQTLAGVTHLEESDIIELEKRYWSLKSQSRTGKFDLETLAPLIHPPVPLSLCEGIFNAFDENRDGHIDFKEMACGISACCKGPLVERQKFCFKIFDQDQDGSLCKTEAYSMVLALLHVRSENIYKNSDCLAYSSQIDEIVSELFSKFDTNKDNTISLDEYLVWSVDQTLPLDLLNLLFQVCHVVFGLKPTRKEEEGDIVRNWLEREERRGLKVGQLWFLISMDWWKSWNEYIDYQDVCSIYAGSGSSSLKRSNKLQKRVDSSLAQTLGDGNSNVTLSSIVTLGEDALASLNSNSSSSSTNSSPYLGYATNDSLSRAAGESILSQMRTLHTPEIPRTPSHSPGMVRKLTAIPPQRPPSIDNSSLVVPSTLKATILTGEGGKLKKNTLLMRGRDFEVVPEAIWRALFQWYGGSPSLPRQVILPQNAIHSEIELYPITLKLFKHHISNAPNRQPGSSWTGVVSSMASAYGIHPFFSFRNTDGASANVYPTNQFNYPKRYLAYLASFSRMATLRQVYDFLCVRLKLRPEDTRLWLYKDDNNLSLLDEEYLTLEQMDIEDNEQVLIEIRNKDLTWPEEMSNLLNAKLDQKHQGPTEKGATGLNNLGNTCFMNAALQCVSNTRPLTLYFINDRHLYELNRTNPLGMKGHIAKRYGDLVQELWSGTSRTIAPLKLRWTIGKYAPRFNGFQQHDSQELLAFLLDGLHEDLNRVHEKPYVELKDSDGRPDADVALEAWENHILRNRSIIVDLFHGQLQSSVTCKVCGHISVRFDPFNYLSLPLPMESCVHTEVIVMKLDGSVPVKYGLRLNHDDKYSAVKQQLSSHCHLSPNQIVLTEVSSSMIKAILSDDQKIRMVMGTCLYAYEIPIYSDLTADDEAKFPKEPQTFTQIQRMGASGKKIVENGVSTSNSVRNVKNSDDDGKVTFKVGADYANDSPGPSSLQSLGCDSIPCVDSLGSAQCGNASSIPISQSLSVAHHSGPQMNLSTSMASSNFFSNHSATGNGQSTCNVSNSVPSASLANARCGSSSASSLSSSLVSNSSAGDLVELARKRFVIAYHRKMNRQEVYFLSSQKTRPALFGLPLVLPCSDGGTTHQDLYQMVWMQVSRLVSPLPPSESSVPNHAQDCDDSLGYEYPFILKVVQKDGVLCAWCPWFRFCRGCQISCGETVFKGSAYIAIDWDPTALHLRYQAPLEKDFINHESVEKTRRQQTEPIDLHACLEAFTKEEHLGEEEKYYCSKCKDHQLASKKLQIWRLPPILIVHLKRFQLLNARWVKSQKIVRFPFENFEPKEYLAKVPKSTVLLAAQEKLLRTKNLNNNNNVSRNEGGDTSSGGELIKSPELNGDSTYNHGKNSSPSITRANSKLDNCRPTATAWESPRKTRDVQILNCEDLAERVKRESTSTPATLPSRDSSPNKMKDFHRHKLLKGYNPYDLRYKLYAIACHSGILGGGHYVSYACNPNNRWYCYNDSSCKEVQPDQLDADSAYMLFYEREGVDYEAYLPNVEGRVQDTKEIDDEFESDFRKMCSIQ